MAEDKDGGNAGGDVNEEVIEVDHAEADRPFRIELKAGGNKLVIKMKPPEYFFSS